MLRFQLQYFVTVIANSDNILLRCR